MNRGSCIVVTPPATASTIELGRTHTGRLEQACELIVDAGLTATRWIIFPEAFIPGCPNWLWHAGSDGDELLDELRVIALANAVSIPGDATDRLCRVAQRAGINVVIGLIERAGTTYYSTLLVIDRQGQICGRTRAPITTSRAQLAWTRAEGGRAGTAPGETRHIGGI